MEDNTVCRVCLEQLEVKNGTNIYETKVGVGELLSDCFELLFDFSVNPNDNLSQLICEKCKLAIELSMSLRKQAIENNETLLQMNVQKNENIEVIYAGEYEDGEIHLINDDENSSGDEETDAVSFLLGKIKSKKTKELQQPEYKKRRFFCSVCGKRFLKRSNLIDHLKIHANSKEFRCEICAKSFIQYGHLKAHIRTHTNERPYECNICGKSYTQGSALKIHMRIHTNDRSYVCDICTKGFTNSSDLGKHKKIHDPVKDYWCMACKVQFTQKVHAKKHITKIHPNANIEQILMKRVDNTLKK